MLELLTDIHRLANFIIYMYVYNLIVNYINTLNPYKCIILYYIPYKCIINNLSVIQYK